MAKVRVKFWQRYPVDSSEVEEALANTKQQRLEVNANKADSSRLIAALRASRTENHYSPKLREAYRAVLRKEK